MLRVVLDTNVLVSGLIMLGKPRELLSIIARREATLVLSKEIPE
ncbi:PIN domain-containing protein [Candidatus Bathyarchaeota archaeon]|nr:PIN domain-containing protein [Candidatus Bathyarchaeota archaeon]